MEEWVARTLSDTTRKASTTTRATADVPSTAASAAAISAARSSVVICQKKLGDEDELQILSLLTTSISTMDHQVSSEALKQLAGFCSRNRAGLECAKENARFLVQQEGLGTILLVMRQCGSDGMIQAAGTRALQNAMCHHPDAASKVHRLGGATVFVNNMFEHDQDKQVQLHSCGAIWNFVIDDSSIERKQAIVQVGGITALVAALLTHPDQIHLQYWACGSLLCLCSCSSGESSSVAVVDAISRTLDVGGLGAVVAAYENHRDHDDIRPTAAKLMKILIEYVDSSEAIEREVSPASPTEAERSCGP